MSSRANVKKSFLVKASKAVHQGRELRFRVSERKGGLVEATTVEVLPPVPENAVYVGPPVVWKPYEEHGCGSCDTPEPGEVQDVCVDEKLCNEYFADRYQAYTQVTTRSLIERNYTIPQRFIVEARVAMSSFLTGERPDCSIGFFIMAHRRVRTTQCFKVKPVDFLCGEGRRRKVDLTVFKDCLSPIVEGIYRFFNYTNLYKLIMLAMFGEWAKYDAEWARLRIKFPGYRTWGSEKAFWLHLRGLWHSNFELYYNFVALLRVESPFYELCYAQLLSPVKVAHAQGWTDRIIERDRAVARVAMDEASDVFVATLLNLNRQAVILQAIVDYIRRGKKLRALGHIWLLATERKSVWKLSQRIYSSIRDYQGAQSDWQATFEIPEEELEEESDDGPLTSHDGEEEKEEVEYLQAASAQAGIMQSALWTKFMSMIMSLLIPDTLAAFPTAMAGYVKIACEAVAKFATRSYSLGAVYDFIIFAGERVVAFFTTWDFNEFLKDGSFGTYLVRGQELLAVNAKGENRTYATLHDFVQQMSIYLEEGDKYRRADLGKMSKKFSQSHEHIFTAVMKLRNKYKTQLSSVSKRKKQPFSAGFAGPPGTGKTTAVEAVGQFIVSQMPERVAPDGTVAMTGSDIYSCKMYVKHFDNCYDPVVFNFNEIPGDGYSEQGFNIADMLRLAVDVEPFSTPQADLADKVFNVINPHTITFTTNSMKWNFASLWGTDWSKLPRRYKNIYYVAYPAVCYERDFDPFGCDHGKLKKDDMEMEPWMEDKLRIYKCKMTELAGNITIKRVAFLGYGREVMLIDIKKKILAFNGLVGFQSDYPKCAMGTRVEYHAEPCLPGCNWNGCVDSDQRKPYREPLVVADAQGLIGMVKKCLAPSFEFAADTVTVRKVERARRILMRKFAMIMAFVAKYKNFLLALTGTALALAIAASSVRKKKIGISDKPKVQVVAEQGNVINPVKHKLEVDLVTRYGIGEGQKLEMANPPTFPANSRVHVFTSAASKTSSFSDVLKMTQHNNVQFACEGRKGWGLFVTPTMLLMNAHVFRHLKGPLTAVPRADNDFKFTTDVETHVFGGHDLVLIRTPVYPCSNLLKHFAKTHGMLIDVVVGGRVKETAEIRGADFRGVPKLDLAFEECVVYNSGGVYGDCGIAVVGDVDGRGLILGIHIAELVNSCGAAMLVTPAMLEEMFKKFPASEVKHAHCSVVALPFVDAYEPLHSKSRFRAANGVSMAVLGTFETAKKLSKSRLKETKLCHVAKVMMEEQKVIPTLHIDGVLTEDGWKAPYVHKFNGMKRVPTADFSRAELARAVDDYLLGAPKIRATPLNLNEAINGVVGNALLKKVNLKTSAGIYQRFYPDKTWLFDLEEINDEFKQRFVEYLRLLEENVIAEHQKWALKDELVTMAKEMVKKYRYFMVSDLMNLLAFRMFVAPLVAHFYENREFYEAYGAFNPASPEFAKMVDAIMRKGLLVMADLKHMDSSHIAIVAEAVAEIFVREAGRAGYNDAAIAIVRNLVMGVVFSIVELNGDVAFLSEGMGSGVYITFIFNCLVLSIMYRVAWLRISKASFRSENVLACGGDDSALGTSCSDFTGNFIAKVFEDYGYELSPPTAKSGEIVDFYPENEFVFLKRSLSVVEWRGTTVRCGALHKDSIWKSLGWEIPSPDVTHLDRMAQVLDAAQREMALHGRQAFDEFHALVKGVYTFRILSWEDCVYRYVMCKFYDDLLEKLFLSSMEVESLQCGLSGKTAPCIPDHYLLCGQRLKEAGRHGKRGVPVFTGLPQQTGAELVVETRNQRGDKPKQSSIFIGNDSKTLGQERTTAFNMASALVESNTPRYTEPDYGRANVELTIQEALSRPVHLWTYTWTPVSTSGVIGEALARWRGDDMVTSKLLGYKFFRGRPKLRFVVNGLMFYYGKLVISADFTPGDDGYATGVVAASFDNDIFMNNISQASTAPHVEIDPSASTTYDLALPWYSANGWYNQFDIPASPRINLQAWIFNQLASANDVAPNSVTVQIYMIMEEVELSVPAFPVFTAQSEEGVGSKLATGAMMMVAPPHGNSDAHKAKGAQGEADTAGTISKPLSALSAVSAMAAGAMPQFSAFLVPFAAVAGGLGEIARYLGYSQPVILEESRPTLNKVVDTLAYTDGRVGISKLTGDPKQGISFTAAAASVGEENDGVLMKIAQRYALVDQMNWQMTGGIADFIVVDPMRGFTVSGYDQYAPVGFVAGAFTYWSGSLDFKFEVVCSGLHRGAIGISWVPFLDSPGTAYMEFPNKYITQIIDLTQTRQTEFKVPFGGDLPNLRVDSVSTGEDSTNGVLWVYEINPLKSSGSLSDVTINIYLRAGSDFQLFRPNLGIRSRYTQVRTAQSELIVKDDVESPPAPKTIIDETTTRAAIYYGEVFHTVKQLCSRSGVIAYGNLDLTGVNGAFRLLYHAIRGVPIPETYVGGGASADNFNTWYLNDFSTYFSPAFLAERGGHRFKFVPYGDNRTTGIFNRPTEFVSAVWLVVNAVITTPWFGVPFTGNFYGYLDSLYMSESTSGAMLDAQWLHPAVEYEVPTMSRARFVNPRKIRNWSAPLLERPAVQLQLPSYVTSAVNGTPWQLWHSVADDYSLHYFMYVPTMKIQTQAA